MAEIVKEAASPMMRNIPNEPVPQNPDCTYLWRTLRIAVDQFVDDNNKFVDFIVELQKLPDANHIFQRLPRFRNHWTEFGYTSRMSALPTQAPTTDRLQ
jgi:hypothetical protein